MEREVKNHEERRREILETAEFFFMTQGYEKTSIQGIIDKIGIAKGTFYHYFKSKEDLLQQWLMNQIDTIIEELEKVADRTDMSAKERLKLMYSSVGSWKVRKKELVLPAMKTFYDDNNIVLREKLFALAIKKTARVYQKIFEEGNGNGEFYPPFPYPEIAGKLVLAMGSAMGEELAPLFSPEGISPEKKETIIRHMHGVEEAFKRIVGINDDSFQLYRYDLLDQLLQKTSPGGKYDKNR